MELVCQKCGKKFNHSRNKAYCDDCVKSNGNTEARICLKCNSIFYVEKYDKYHYRKQLYCNTCSNIKQETKTLICQRCGKEFTVGKYPGTDSFIKRRFCSEECARSVPEKTAICETCGKEFKLERTEDGHFLPRKYCSRECRLKIQREKLQQDYAERQEKIRQTCQEKYGVDYNCLLPQCINANPMAISKINLKFADKLKQENIKYIQEYKIKDYIYDFYLPDLDTLIEINPTFTHTNIESQIYKSKDKDYHVNKTKNAYPKRCINIWDWDNQDQIIKSLQAKTILYARKLQLTEITKQTANEFLVKYHFQGKCKNNEINLGLYYNNQLVQVMTFGKPRYNKNYQWELLRLCTDYKYKIVGGAERLFKYFVRNYDPKSIISYCDLSKFNGNVYEKLGFHKTSNKEKPSKHWSKQTNHITDNLLRQRGFDQLFNTNYGKNTSNEQLMLEHGWLSIYDCGQAVYIWEK